MMNTLTPEQAYKAAHKMSLGGYGSFAQSIGEALMYADSTNHKTLLEAFQGLFQMVYESTKTEKGN